MTVGWLSFTKRSFLHCDAPSPRFSQDRGWGSTLLGQLRRDIRAQPPQAARADILRRITGGQEARSPSRLRLLSKRWSPPPLGVGRERCPLFLNTMAIKCRRLESNAWAKMATETLSLYIYINTCVCGHRFILYKVFVSITSTCTVINPLQWIPRVDTLDTLSIAKNHPPLSHRFLKWRISNWENERLKQAQVS